ncbi:RNA polymerase-associated protein Rtf1 [Asbolus verrucosus]|uniref:RNA polymerase-associated protein Rtf1 n=1 Tax=Asbolus verrucosus TaxID=1661398 RepID=A0A482VDN6_ASBVE|nr:RNA polymerase-associated protein Rtf1 [Asbolus verrucosus]
MLLLLFIIIINYFQGLRVRHGNQERVFRLEFVSNQEFTDSEYHKWIEASTAASNALPTKERVEQKQADIKEALNYEFNEQDIERIIREKERFKPNPHNYAMRKTQLMKERDSAMARGDEELARDLGRKISDLEERASELDKLRTSTISSISYINDRNRKRNVEEAEKAILAEVKANKGKKIDDPFTRRSTKPRMNFKAAPEEKVEQVVEAKPEKVIVEVENPKVATQPAQVTQDDLFSAHDFDIKIDLDVPLPGNYYYFLKYFWNYVFLT